MSFVALSMVLAVALAAASAAIIYALRLRRTTQDERRKQFKTGPTADEHLHGMRYRAWGDPDRELLFVEGQCRAITGFSAGELVDGPVEKLSQLIHPEDRNLVKSEVKKACELVRPYQINYRIRTKNGKWRWVSDRGGPIVSEDEALTGVEGTLLDITDRVSAELARVRVEERYNLLAENIDDLIGIHDADGRFQYVTPSAKGLIGYEPAELLQKPIYAIIHPDDREAVRSKIAKRVQEDCEPLIVEHRLRTKQGRYLPVTTQCKPVQDRDGYYTRFITVSRDVSEIRRLQRGMKEVRSQSAQTVEMDDMFIANMDYQVRTPLNSIVGFAEILADEVAESQRNALEMIRESGEHILATLTSVMDYSAAAAASTASLSRRIDIVPLARAEVDRYREAAGVKGVVLQFVAEAEPLFAVAEPESCSRILDALLSNAVKFTESDDVITVTALREDDHAVLRVSDTGIGISAGFLPHVFEPFRQEQAIHSGKPPDAGLGLALAKRLTESMAGSIDVDSKKGKGSVLTVRLPGAGRTRIPTSEVYKNTSSRESRVPSRSLGRVLAVEDNAPMRIIMVRYLQAYFEVDASASAEEAIEMASQESYELVLLDINLGSEMNGMDVLKEVQALPGYDSTFFIAVTAYALPEEKNRFLRAGFDGFVSKPFTRESLLKEISRVTMLSFDTMPNRKN